MKHNYQKHIRMLFPDKSDFNLSYETAYVKGEGFQILERYDLVGGMEKQEEGWVVWLDYYDPGGIDSPPDWYGKAVGIFDNYWTALNELALAIRKRDIDMLITSMAEEGIDG